VTGSSRRRLARTSNGWRAKEAGAASLELLVLIPLLFTFALVAFQVGVIAWTASSTAEAVREAARAESLNQNPWDAAEAALPARLRGGASLNRVGSAGHGFELKVKAPTVSGLPAFTVTRTAAMP